MKWIQMFTAISAAMALCSCGQKEGTPKCIAGESKQCACESGASGAQVCGLTGQFEACSCTQADGGANTDPVDSGIEPDAGDPPDLGPTCVESNSPCASSGECCSRNCCRRSCCGGTCYRNVPGFPDGCY